MELKKIKKTEQITCFLLLVILCGCTQNEVVTGGLKGEDVSVCFHLNVLAATTLHTRSDTTIVTRSESDPGETADKTLYNLWMGQYNSTGELVAEEYFPSLPKQESVNLPLKRMSGTCHVWAVANAGNLNNKAVSEIDLKSLYVSDVFTEEGLPTGNLCVMTGMWSGEITDNISADIQLSRSLAKIKFTYSVGGENFSFTPTTLELCNVPVKMKYIGDENPEQLTGESDFTTYRFASPGNSSTHYWYMPENPAGKGNNTENKATNKTGDGVEHATCIKLTGEALQDGVLYNDVVFTLYPGNGNNDYNIVRNGLYTINITLTGIDFSDKRVTVGTVPEMQDPDNLGAEKGATGIFQVTTRPGIPWSFTIPNWLSAIVGEHRYESGNRLDFVGPYKVEFETATANPRAEIRETSFTVGEKEIKVRQDASSLTVGSSISLSAEGTAVGNGTFQATKGLPWSATLSSEWGNWLEWDGTAPTPGVEASGTNESLAIKAISSNPSSSVRRGSLQIKGGESVGNSAYIGLTGSISVTQAGSTISGAAQNIGPEASANLAARFIATHDLPWVATVTSGNSWLTLLTSSTGTTDGNSQAINYKSTLNLSSSERTGKITVSVGNGAGDEHPGPVTNITVTQSGSVFDVSPTSLDFENTESSGQVIITGTEGLPWTVTRKNGSTDISVNASGSMLDKSSQFLTFTAPANIGEARSATFTVAVTGENHSKTVTVNQAAGVSNKVTINSAVVASYKSVVTDFTLYPPFNYDGGSTTSSWLGSDRNGKSSDCTLTSEYSIEVEEGERGSTSSYEGAANYCKAKKDGWRVPTIIELRAIYDNRVTLQNNGVAEFKITQWYWSSSVFNKNGNGRCMLKFRDNGGTGNDAQSQSHYVRCVRDL